MKPFIIPAKDRPKLRKHVMMSLGYGRKAALLGRIIASQCGYADDRLIRVMIRELIAEGVPIASAVSEPMGFFIVETDNEAANYIRTLKERIREDANRLRDFEAAVASFSPPAQLAMEVNP